MPKLLRTILVSPGRSVTVTPVYDTYWRFAALRQGIFMRRVQGLPPPWTDDPVLVKHRFTNAYRASDRVSQYLIRDVLYRRSQQPLELFFRTLLFKLFNRIDTWERLVDQVGWPTWETYDFKTYAQVLDRAMADGKRVYSAAYIMPSPPFGSKRKHRNHLRLIEHMMEKGAPRLIEESRSLGDVFRVLRGYPSLGDFLAFQFAVDLNYSSIAAHSENEFVVAGPGARDGIRKCFADTAGYSDSDLIRFMTDRAESEFAHLELNFPTLWGRPLHLIDCQNIFCEVDKYARVMHPTVRGASGRTRIKQVYSATGGAVPQWYPPKWRLAIPSKDASTSDVAQQSVRRGRRSNAA